jgi:hypothetical protein
VTAPFALEDAIVVPLVMHSKRDAARADRTRSGLTPPRTGSGRGELGPRS